MELCIISVSRIMNQIPIGFVLGFYVSLIYRRFWRAYLAIPSPNKTAIYLTNYLRGNDEEAVLMRRTAVRYVCAAFVLAMRTVNIPIKKRFPTLKHVGDSGLLSKQELATYEKIEESCKFHSSFVPLLWCASIARKAFEKKKIMSSVGLNDILKAIDDFRANCQTVFNYDSVNVPLCYTQAVTFGCYSYFAAALIGYQFIPEHRAQMLKDHGVRVPRGYNCDIYVPFFAIIQFFIYIGLMKVAEALLNPHGENDDDVEICNQVDKNLLNSYLITTDMYDDLPELVEDMYWDSAAVNLPYTDAACRIKERRPMPTAHVGSLFHYSVTKGTELINFQLHRRTASTVKSDQAQASKETESTKINMEVKREAPDQSDVVEEVRYGKGF